jgi:hypothetical protein
MCKVGVFQSPDQSMINLLFYQPRSPSRYNSGHHLERHSELFLGSSELSLGYLSSAPNFIKGIQET